MNIRTTGMIHTVIFKSMVIINTGTGSVSDPNSMGSWIRIRIANAGPDPEGGTSASQKEEKLCLKTRKKL
jgi:hypothetical protein